MKKYRKISAFIIALTLCISMAACGSTDSSDNTAAANTIAIQQINNTNRKI